MVAKLPPVASRAGKYLIFVLGAKQYGVEIIKVREILGVPPIIPMPQAPHYIKGVINLRGKVIPIIDTWTKFGISERENTSKTCIIVVDVGGKSIGLLVDTVKEVVNIREEQIEAPPNFGTSAGNDFVRSLGKIGDQVKILLDIDQMLGNLESSDLAR